MVLLNGLHNRRLFPHGSFPNLSHHQSRFRSQLKNFLYKMPLLNTESPPTIKNKQKQNQNRFHSGDAVKKNVATKISPSKLFGRLSRIMLLDVTSRVNMPFGQPRHFLFPQRRKARWRSIITSFSLRRIFSFGFDNVIVRFLHFWCHLTRISPFAFC